MRSFNPDKELRKIQKGNKNKVVLFVISLLIVGVMGYSFALYQVRYSKRIIYTKVAPFSSRDVILSIKIDGENVTRETFPSQDEDIRFVDLECDEPDITTGDWNYETWSLDLNTKGPNKCTALFAKPKLFSELIIADDILILNDDPDNNLRYVGQNPNNYIWFNCDSYDKLTQSIAASRNCEKWRIIGLFNNITKSDGTKENLVKIIKADRLGDIAWASNNSNNWANASLQTSLNTTYYNGTTLGNGKGITSSTRKMIEQVTWNLGASSASNTAQEFYGYERGTEHYGSNPTTWNGYIALLYPSDYGYATSGETISREECLKKDLNVWGSGDYKTDCAGNSWVLDSDTTQWTLTTWSQFADGVFDIRGNGFAGWGLSAYKEKGIRPSLYLKSSVKILDGKNNSSGSEGTPYILVP